MAGAQHSAALPNVPRSPRPGPAVGSTPAQFEQRFKADPASFAKIVKEAHIPLQD
jgi:hypothetical protein